MGQDLIMKFDATAATAQKEPLSSVGTHQSSPNADNKEPSEAEHFASTLENQISQQKKRVTTNSVKNESEIKDTKLKSSVQSESVEGVSGNKLPQDFNEIAMGTDEMAPLVLNEGESLAQNDVVSETSIATATSAEPKGKEIPIPIADNISLTKEALPTPESEGSEDEIEGDIPLFSQKIKTSKSMTSLTHTDPVSAKFIKVDEGVKDEADTILKDVPNKDVSKIIVSSTLIRNESPSKTTKTISNTLNANGKENKHSSEKEAIATLKQGIELNQQEVRADNKHSAPIVRSDILNAINAKKSKKVSGEEVKTAKVTANQVVNELDKMMGVISQKKTDEIQLKAVPDRNTGRTLVASMPSFSSMSSFAEPATLGMQSTSLSQPVLAMQPAMQSEAWNKVLSSRVIWMAREGVQKAELKLNPTNLGPVEVKLHMSNDQASVSFIAHNVATREALEQALPKLRESFQENGMDLTHSDVSEEDLEKKSEEDETHSLGNKSKDEGSEQLSLDENEHVESGELELGVSVFA